MGVTGGLTPREDPLMSQAGSVGTRVGHAAAAVIVLVGVYLTATRPTAPATGALVDLADWFEPQLLGEAVDYRQPRHWVLLARMATELMVVLGAAFTPAGRRVVDRIVRRVGFHRPARAAGTVVGVALMLVSVVTWPFALYLGFVREGQFGFRTQGFGG